MNTVLKTIIATAQEIHDFNRDLFDEEIAKKDYTQAFHRRAHTMGKIEGLKSLLIQLNAAGEISDAQYERFNGRLHKLWKFVLGWD